jgi:hypothetical protein
MIISTKPFKDVIPIYGDTDSVFFSMNDNGISKLVGIRTLGCTKMDRDDSMILWTSSYLPLYLYVTAYCASIPLQI